MDLSDVNLAMLTSQIVAAGCPIFGLDDTGQIHFRDEATDEQRKLAEQLVATAVTDTGKAELAAAALVQARAVLAKNLTNDPLWPVVAEVAAEAIAPVYDKLGLAALSATDLVAALAKKLQG